LACRICITSHTLIHPLCVRLLLLLLLWGQQGVTVGLCAIPWCPSHLLAMAQQHLLLLPLSCFASILCAHWKQQQ
jgi:hypothetical protein